MDFVNVIEKKCKFKKKTKKKLIKSHLQIQEYLR